MPDETRSPQAEQLPATSQDLPQIVDVNMPPALRLWLDDRMFNRARLVASYIAKAEGVTPKHLVNKPEACFAVVEIALNWRMSPSAVARCTYQTPNGGLGFYGKLCQAVLENSGHLEGNVKFEHFGPWEKIRGRFHYAQSDSGKGRTPVQDWKDADEEGIGVWVRAKVRNEEKPRELQFFLRQATVRNSTLWVADPEQQICYTAVRRFADRVMPGIFMGLPFDYEGDSYMVDVTPPPRPEPPSAQDNGEAASGEQQQKAEKEKTTRKREHFQVVDFTGEPIEYTAVIKAVEAFQEALRAAQKDGAGERLEQVWESNALFLTQLRESGREKNADGLSELYVEMMKECDAQAKKPVADATQQQQQDQKPAAAPSAGVASAGASPQGPAGSSSLSPPATSSPSAAVAWTWKHPSYKELPQSPRFGGSRGQFVGWLADMIKSMPVDQIPDLFSKDNYGSELALIREKALGDYEDLQAIAKQRGVTIR